MSNISGIKKVSEVLGEEETKIYEISGMLQRPFPLAENRIYVIPGYQREIRWSTEDVQTLIDDLVRGGKKFLGTVTLSTLDGVECEVIDGQQRLTVLTLIITYLNSLVKDSKKFEGLCHIRNESFLMFEEALKNRFEYDLLRKKNRNIYDAIVDSDILNQRFDFQTIWDSIRERVNNCPEKEKLLSALLESDINIIINHVDGTDSQRKFCIDYFIDINDKRKELDSLDIIRAYAFKEDFDKVTKHWVSIQKKCTELNPYVKYSREELFYQYFVCMVNKELDNCLTKPIGEKYLIKENVIIHNHMYSKGTVVWNLFSNDKFYARLLEDLDDYLDFITMVKSIETGGADAFKKLFFEDADNMSDSTKILNAHTIINSILRNDDVVPKMMVMKYYLEVLKPQFADKKAYSSIHYINIIATLFTSNGKRKGSEQIGSRLMQIKWIDELKELAYKMLVGMSDTTDFSKVAKINRKYTVESGQYMARRYLTLCDSYTWNNGNISPNEECFKNLNISTGTYNMEHFIINRDYKYALYTDDTERKICAEISLPRKYRKYIATIANYLILDSSVNSSLKNRPVFEKIELLEKKIRKRGISYVIPSKRSQMHFYQIKEHLHDNSNYPKERLDEAKTRKEKEALLKDYYAKYFEDEYLSLAREMDSIEALFIFETREKLLNYGFTYDGYILEYDTDTFFSTVKADINPKEKEITLSVEVYNPFYGENVDDEGEGYDEIIETVKTIFLETFKKCPHIRSSNEYGGSDDESITFAYDFKMNENNIRKFIDAVMKAHEAVSLL